MKSQFRPTSPEDAAAVSGFLQSVFSMPPDHPNLDERLLYWKSWEPWTDWPEKSRGYVLAQGDTIGAHGSIVPLVCRWNDRSLPVVRIIDWAAQSKPIGGGVMLLKRIGQMTGAVMAVGGTEMTLKIFPALGAQQFGCAYLYARPLRPLRRFLSRPKKNVRAVASLGRSLAWGLQAPSSAPAGWTTRRLAASDLDSVNFPRPAPRPGLAVFERSTASLRYYLGCPGPSFELHLVERNNEPQGYLLLSFAKAQARIAESWVQSEDPGDWQALHRLAVRCSLAHPEVVELVTMCSDPLTRQSLEDTGFHLRGSMDLYLLDTGKTGLPDVPLRVQMLEGDDAYLQDMGDGLWA